MIKKLNKDYISNVLMDNGFYIEKSYYVANQSKIWDTFVSASNIYKGKKLTIKIHNHSIVYIGRFGKHSKQNYAYINHYNTYDCLRELITREVDDFYTIVCHEIFPKKEKHDE